MRWTDCPDTSFALLGIATREISISRLLAALLRSSQDQALWKALGILSPLPTPDLQLCVATEVWVHVNGRARVADIAAAWVTDGHAHLLIIENKLYASEGVEQTSDLIQAEAQLREALGAGLIGPEPPVTRWEAAHWRYLSLFGEAAVETQFRAVRYDAVVPALLACAGSDVLARLAREFGVLLQRFYAWPARARGGSPASAWRDCASDPLDAGFLVFDALAEEVAIHGGLEHHGAYRGSASGRSWYGAHLSAAHWTGRPPGTRRDDEFDSDHDWWVAFQLRYYRSTVGRTGTFDIALYFETLPYCTERQFQKTVTCDAAAARYRARRRQFCANVATGLQGLPWSVAGHWCQVAKYRLAIDLALPWASSVASIAEVVRRAVPAVETAFKAIAKPSPTPDPCR